jgi:hypothetical protein
MPAGRSSPFGKLRDLVHNVQSKCAVDHDEQLFGSLASDWREQVMVLLDQVEHLAEPPPQPMQHS